MGLNKVLSDHETEPNREVLFSSFGGSFEQNRFLAITFWGVKNWVMSVCSRVPFSSMEFRIRDSKESGNCVI